jgi:uncharacterized membrane protein
MMDIEHLDSMTANIEMVDSDPRKYRCGKMATVRHTPARMNSEDRLHLAAIIERQRDAHALLEDLDRRIRDLRHRVESSSSVAATIPPAARAAAQRVEPPPLPEPVAATPIAQMPPQDLPVPITRTTPRTIPEAACAPPATPMAAPSRDASAGVKESMELRMGSYWLVRIGIAIFLTGLVFLGNFAYHQFVAPLDAAGKLIILYVIGGSLAAFGAHLDRTRPAMRNYARVLLAGGCAAIYYTTYAAHYVERLRVIDSPLVGGALLLALAGGIVWVAERKRSETLALVAVVLGFYTSCINAIGEFTLFSTLLLAIIALVFQMRHGWSRLFWASLVGTYGSYGFWQFHHLLTGAPPASSVVASACLTAYWLIFTAALFGVRSRALADGRPAFFFSANNAAFFLLAGHHVATSHPDSYWLFATAFGFALIAIGVAVPARFCAAQSLRPVALAQGLALTTLGLATKLTGPQLALAFAAESAVLLICAQWRYRRLLRCAAALLAVAATALGMAQIDAHPHLILPLGATVASFLLFDAWSSKRPYDREAHDEAGQAATFFGVLFLVMLGGVIWHSANPSLRPAMFGLAALVITLLQHPLRLPELVLPAHAYALLGLLLLMNAPVIAALPLGVFIAAMLLLEQWWERAPRKLRLLQSREPWQLLLAGCATCVALRAIFQVEGQNGKLLLLSGAALGTFIYGLAVPAWSTLVTGQLFTFAAAGALCISLVGGHPDPICALAPIVAPLLVARLLRRFASRTKSSGEFAEKISRGYDILAALLGAAWIFEFVPVAWQSPVFAAFSAAAFGMARWRKSRGYGAIGAICAAMALLLIWLRFDDPVTIAQLLGLIAVGAAAHLLRSALERADAMRENIVAVLIGVVATTWWWVTRWTVAQFGAQNLTVSWSVAALLIFLAGFAMRERIYRLGGMAILVWAIGRVFAVDVWQLDTLFRILSFLVLGGVLLLLGFLYNRFAEQIRRWL